MTGVKLDLLKCCGPALCTEAPADAIGGLVGCPADAGVGVFEGGSQWSDCLEVANFSQSSSCCPTHAGVLVVEHPNEMRDGVDIPDPAECVDG